MMNKIFLLSHQDDEIAIFNHIKKSAKVNTNIHIFYLTNGRIKKINEKKIIQIREKETIKALSKLGVKKNRIIFLGKKLKINSYELHENLNITFHALSNFFRKIKKDTIIYTHSWEGGNVDHDSCFIITLKLMKRFSKIKQAFQFSLYNSNNMPLKLFRAFSPLKNNGQIIKEDINFMDKIRFILILFFYKSQMKIWLGLYPFLIFRIILNKYGYLQTIKKSFLIKKPHRNKLWYEKRNFITYNNLKIIFLKFLHQF